MNITTRKCDVCQGRHDSDNPDYSLYSQLTEPTGQVLDVCPDCTRRLFSK